ncbi:VOC family protein [Aquimarina mytili]|uniref:VOC family protein n=1 Tax=Aquimarina mytili TaxID=874423 RepID=A0A936ZUG7_9FLAO|nr:VOC family protein [Aquimarina mytili]MBL0685799.1 VOC family protein [Aquimarina mytili]
MLPNNPFFADISTYSPEKTMSFYKHVFGWTYYKSGNYYIAYLGNDEVSGLYKTPEKFKQMRMPHFWMTYIQVTNLDATVDKAKQLGGIIEMNYEISGFGKVALIRDPQGAGFTIYKGSKLKTTRTKNKENTLIWNELHVSDVKNTIPFYKGIFEWEIVQNQDGVYEILNHKEEHVADILEIQNQYKGKYEYWVCTFGVDSLKNTKNIILRNGGHLVSEENNRILFADNSNEAFFYIKEV